MKHPLSLFIPSIPFILSFLEKEGAEVGAILTNPTLRRVADLLNLPLHGNKRDARRIVCNVQIHSASTQRANELLEECTLLIVSNSRDEFLVTMAKLNQLHEYRSKIVGLVIQEISPIGRITQKIIESSNIPYLHTQSHTTAVLYQLSTEDVSKLTAEDTENIALVLTLIDSGFDFDALNTLFGGIERYGTSH